MSSSPRPSEPFAGPDAARPIGSEEWSAGGGGSPWLPAGDKPVSSRSPWGPRRERVWLHVLLLGLTLVTTTFAGGLQYFTFIVGFDDAPSVAPEFLAADFWTGGLWFSLTVLGILGCHEMGHYLACRYYGVNASLPYFLPAPLPLTGTLGAFIRIRSRIPSRVALFDIGLAGPIAGFVVAVPALFIGLYLSRVVTMPEEFTGLQLGEPLVFQLASRLVFGDLPAGLTVNMHPMAFASWFGLLATALNLFPVGQLDGGHVSYAVLGRRSIWVTGAMVLVAVGLAAMSSSWTVWTALLILMLFVVGPHHPPTVDDYTPLEPSRLVLAVCALVMLIICFTPAPIEQIVAGGN